MFYLCSNSCDNCYFYVGILDFIEVLKANLEFLAKFALGILDFIEVLKANLEFLAKLALGILDFIKT